MTTEALVEAPLRARRGPTARAGRETPASRGGTAEPERTFRIRSADSYVVRTAANSLIQQRYAWRGYHAVSLPQDQTSNRITLSATEGDETIGTITVVLDSAEGLAAEDAFADEVAALRAGGARVCEFSKLAIDPISGSQHVLAALFHVAYIVAHRLRGHDVLVMEVNPRHVRYYERMIGARVVGGPRTNRFVDAPAVLLAIGFDEIAARITAAHCGDEPDERTIYAHAFSAREEEGIVGRLMTVQTPVSAAIN